MSRKSYAPPTIERHMSGLMNKFGAGRSSRTCETVAGVSVSKLVAEHGSPLYVFSESVLREQYRSALRAFSKRYPRVRFAWSYKTNYLSAICRVFHSEGALAEVVSDFEYAKARNLGMPGSQIVLNGPYKTPALLRQAVEEGARIHIDNLDELLNLEALATERKQVLDVGIRVNMDAGVFPVWTKFGFNYESGEAWRTIKRICGGGKLRLTGLHTHIGTYILEPNAYAVAAEKLLSLAAGARAEYGHEVEYLDLGGGFASRSTLHSQYLPGEHVVPSFDQYAEALCNALHAHLPAGMQPPMLYLETGRALVDEAGSLICSVVAVKKTPDGGRALVVDAGINLLYTSTWYKFSVLPAQEHFGAVSNAILYGPLCMNIDVLREQVTLPQMQPGDKLVISPVGAYNVTQSMQFIFHRPRVVLVSDDGTVDVIREREDLAHIERLERIPARLREQAAGTPA